MGLCCAKQGDLTIAQKKCPLVNNRWRIGRTLGKGGYGKVMEVIDVNDNKAYAMKTEHLRPHDTTGRLPQEALVLEEMAKKNRDKHVPQLLDKGRLVSDPDKPPVQYIVMSLLGPSLSDMRKFCKNKQFSPTSVGLVAYQALEAIEDIHLTGYVHRDIKPGNFMIGRGNNKHLIYLIDFGMAKSILNDDGTLKPIRKDPVPFRGTTRYCAADSHKGVEYGRHHDLWCMFNSLMELRKGELPWEPLEGNLAATYEIKHRLVPNRWLEDVEPEYLTLYESFTTLFYDITPLYDDYKNVVIDMLKRDNWTLTSPFEWEPGHPQYSRFDKTVLMKLFHDNLP